MMFVLVDDRPTRGPWNKGKLIGRKKPLKLKEVWRIRVRLQWAGDVRGLALFNMAIDSTLRACDLVKCPWAGLVPRQHTTGGRPRLYGITKNGNPYLRQLFIHGARSLVRRVADRSDPRSRWIQGLIERRGKNKAIEAIANKNARIAWAVLSRQVEYRPA